ncbi:hypothetical protein [Streptomyces sp. URMC 129]|uniref:hypothetical protein n=1 Tax=Streptomyces sp. URMC 129 TaxID=3423407 RepID=UPI003F19F6AB
MTTTPAAPTAALLSPPARRHAGDRHRHRPKAWLRALAIASCVPYLALKIAWLSGSHLGIPEGSALRSPEGEDTLFVANAATACMDAAVIVLALALTRPWGRRLPAWLVAWPLWVATGLLAPIVVGFPVGSLVELFTGTPPGAERSEDELFLDPWVFTVVYTGFGLQALALGGLFVRYVRERWGHLLSGRLAGLPRSASAAAQRAGAVAAALLCGAVLTVQTGWLAGGTTGLSGKQVADRDAMFYVTTSSTVLFLLAAAAGVLLLAFRPRRRGRTRLFTAVALAWTGSAALAAWGGWLLLAGTLTGETADPGERATPVMNLLYAGQMLTGMLILAVGARFLAERAASAARPPR